MDNIIYDNKSINRLILYFSGPAILSLIIEIMASVVDTAFAGHLGSESLDALTAMGLLTPLLNVFTAIQSLSAVSTSIYIAKCLNDKSKCDSYFITGITMTLVISSVISIIGFSGTDRILEILNAEKRVFVLAGSYLKIQFISNIFSALGYTLTSILRAMGYPYVEMLITISSVVVNIIFNTLFAFGMQLGFIGLASGTLISEIFCALSVYLWLQNKKMLPSTMNIKTENLKSCAKELFRLGIAQTMIQAAGVCTGFFVNHSLMMHFGNTYIAVWNVVSNIYTLFLMPVAGITQAIQTMIAYYSGHGKEKEKNKTIRHAIIITLIYGGLATADIFIFGKSILSVFIKDIVLLSIAENVIRIIFISFSLMGIFYTVMTLLEVTEREIKAVIMILTRQFFLIVPLVYILPLIFPEYALSVFLAVPVSDAGALCLSLIFVIKR